MIENAALASVEAKIAALVACRFVVASPAFRSAAFRMQTCPGRVIVSGIGKSGHIGRKIAATLMSTGTRAAFLHPSEAAHGDMGMIGPDDLILMLSNSGETDELAIVMDHAEAEAISVIIITARPEARLAQRAQMVLAYHVADEGCPIERAPMASTVAQLAIGDALAAALMVAKGFSVEDFAHLHHGGYLGRRAREEAA